ncbi:hypothetical protein TKK_0002942 [Trichogramma kaykai]|uniref:Uncharacterized protein n=1 Tax=Trichogramma kaykai TaxID=54128 RepID=A0ABD2XR90_9HYME
MNEGREYKIVELRKDILNLPNHIFGDHTKCAERSYDCSEIDKGGESTEKNYVADMEKVGLFQKLCEIMGYMSDHANSLLHRVTNNYAEAFNIQVAVTIGGKRINWGLRGQYAMRVYAAVLRHNTGALLSHVFGSFGDIPTVVKIVD